MLRLRCSKRQRGDTSPLALEEDIHDLAQWMARFHDGKCHYCQRCKVTQCFRCAPKTLCCECQKELEGGLSFISPLFGALALIAVPAGSMSVTPIVHLMDEDGSAACGSPLGPEVKLSNSMEQLTCSLCIKIREQTERLDAIMTKVRVINSFLRG